MIELNGELVGPKEQENAEGEGSTSSRALAAGKENPDNAAADGDGDGERTVLVAPDRVELGSVRFDGEVS